MPRARSHSRAPLIPRPHRTPRVHHTPRMYHTPRVLHTPRMRPHNAAALEQRRVRVHAHPAGGSSAAGDQPACCTCRCGRTSTRPRHSCHTATGTRPWHALSRAPAARPCACSSGPSPPPVPARVRQCVVCVCLCVCVRARASVVVCGCARKTTQHTHTHTQCTHSVRVCMCHLCTKRVGRGPGSPLTTCSPHYLPGQASPYSRRAIAVTLGGAFNACLPTVPARASAPEPS